MRVPEDGFDDDSESSRNESFGNYSQAFVGNRNNFPVDVLFSMFITTAPVFVTLSSASGFPISNLALLRAVSSFLASTTNFGRDITNFKAKSAVS